MCTNITPQKIETRIYVTRGNSKFQIPFEYTTYVKQTDNAKCELNIFETIISV